jgi:hypothetical protein
MAQGLFTVGFTVAEVLRIQARAKEMLMEGKTLMSWADSGSNATKQFPMTVKETLEECVHALRVLDRSSHGRRRNILNSIINYFAK